MFGPYQLTRVVLVLLVIVFVGVISYMFLYNRRLKSHDKQLRDAGFKPVSKEAEILAETRADSKAGHHHDV